VLIIRLLLACARSHFEIRHNPEASECWRHLKQAISPEICITHLKSCKQVLDKDNSRKKRNDLDKFTSWLTFSQISLRQKEYYKIKIIPIVSKKMKSSKKAGWEPGTVIGIYVNSMYQWIPGSGDIRALDFSPFSPSSLASGAAVMAAIQ